MSEFQIRPVEAADIEPLRAALLRGEEEPGEGSRPVESFHVGGYREESLVGFASIVRHRIPGSRDPSAWEIRGIAVDYGHRGYGLGGLLLRRCLDHAAARGARVVWCRIPAGAYGFFERFGFSRHGDPFEVAGRGPHYTVTAVMANGRAH